MMKCFKISLICFFISIYINVYAQADSIEVKRFSKTERHAVVGNVSVLDTYLSPEQYSGTAFMYRFQQTKQKPNNKFSSQVTLQLEGEKAVNRSGNNSYLAGGVKFLFTRFYNKKMINNNLTISMGASIYSNLGFTYNVANGNNPAQINSSIAIAPTFSAEYKFLLFEKQLFAKYQISVPLLGLAFVPNYGQSYYEMFSKNNYDKNIVLISPFNAPSWYQSLTVNCKIKSYYISVGYLNDVKQLKANNLKQHFRTSSIMIGFVKELTIYGKK